MGKKVVNLIVELLIQEKIKYIFGVTGKGISSFINAILDYDQIHYISAKHESGAAFMAFGYAQSTHSIGVCCATTGGGATNLATGVATAYMNSVPLLVLTGQIARDELIKGSFQDSTGYSQSINTTELFKAITKESFSLNSLANISEVIHYAIKTALSGRMGPIHIGIPLDIQNSFITPPDNISPAFLPPKICCSSLQISKLLMLIQEASHPVLLLGWGSVISDANTSLIDIAEQLNIPVITTIQGKGAIPTNHPLSLGIIGLTGHQSAQNYLFECSDLLIAIGTSFGEFTTFGWDNRFQDNKKIIQIDIDPRELGKIIQLS